MFIRASAHVKGRVDFIMIFRGKVFSNLRRVRRIHCSIGAACRRRHGRAGRIVAYVISAGEFPEELGRPFAVLPGRRPVSRGFSSDGRRGETVRAVGTDRTRYTADSYARGRRALRCALRSAGPRSRANATAKGDGSFRHAVTRRNRRFSGRRRQEDARSLVCVGKIRTGPERPKNNTVVLFYPVVLWRTVDGPSRTRYTRVYRCRSGRRRRRTRTYRARMSRIHTTR